MKINSGHFRHEYLKELLEKEGRKVSWVADRVGIKPASLRRVCAGDLKPGRAVVKLLSQILGVNEEDFYDKAS